jgi:hypothetical protein
MRIFARPDTASRTNYYRIKANDTPNSGDNGSNGGFSSHTEKNQTASNYEGRESNPLLPLTPQNVVTEPCPRCDGEGCTWCA